MQAPICQSRSLTDEEETSGSRGALSSAPGYTRAFALPGPLELVFKILKYVQNFSNSLKFFPQPLGIQELFALPGLELVFKILKYVQNFSNSLEFFLQPLGIQGLLHFLVLLNWSLKS